MLLVDVGNTHTVFAISDSKQAPCRIRSDRNQTADELRFLVYGLLGPSQGSPKKNQHLVLGSVVPELTALWKESFSDFKILSPDHRSPWSFEVAIDQPHQAGIDRLANIEGALQQKFSNSIVIDLGTATTFDVVAVPNSLSASKQGRSVPLAQYLGGVISPGPGTSLEALIAHASKLRSIPLLPDSARFPVVGSNTEDALRSGVLHGLEVFVSGMIERIQIEMKWKARPRIYLTGGFSEFFSHLHLPGAIRQIDLTLRGLQAIGSRIRESR